MLNLQLDLYSTTPGPVPVQYRHMSMTWMEVHYFQPYNPSPFISLGVLSHEGSLALRSFFLIICRPPVVICLGLIWGSYSPCTKTPANAHNLCKDDLNLSTGLEDITYLFDWCSPHHLHQHHPCQEWTQRTGVSFSLAAAPPWTRLGRNLAPARKLKKTGNVNDSGDKRRKVRA